MPEVYNNHSDTVQFTSYKNESELPRNIKIFIKELRRNLGDNLKFDEYIISKSLLSPDDDNYDENDNNDDLDLDYNVDAEAYAKGETLFNRRMDIQDKFQYLADGLGIIFWNVHVQILNKKEFGEKFLKDLKKYMKSSHVGQYIHAIKFNLNNRFNLELEIILKKDFWREYAEVKEVAKEYLQKLGYKNMTVHIP